MKRIILAILIGILFPVLYTIVVAFISELLPQYNLDTMMVKGQPSMGLIFAPVAVPFWIDDYIRFYRYFGLRMILDTFWFRVIFTLGFNFLLYTGLSYLCFWYFGLFGQSKKEIYQDPPSPPSFEL